VTVPVTVKIRKGWDDTHVNAVEMAVLAAEKGAAAVMVHGRTREQFYGGKADWQIIRQVAEAIDIPVIGSGDIFCASRCPGYAAGNRLCRCYGGPGCPGQSLDIFRHFCSPAGGRTPGPAAAAGKNANGPAAHGLVGGAKRGKSGHPGNAQACFLVYARG
jgi:hypothetical protein